MMLSVFLVLAVVFCAVQAIRADRLLANALWLAGVSALLALQLYVLEARDVAVIELSVGAGLVTVLFVFAINIAGEEVMAAPRLLPKPLAWGLIILASLLLGWLTLPLTGVAPSMAEAGFAGVLWEQRGLDMLVQIVLIFVGVLGVVGLLSESKLFIDLSLVRRRNGRAMPRQASEVLTEETVALPQLDEEIRV